MRFLFFNVIVVLALVYLFGGDLRLTEVRGWSDLVAATEAPQPQAPVQFAPVETAVAAEPRLPKSPLPQQPLEAPARTANQPELRPLPSPQETKEVPIKGVAERPLDAPVRSSVGAPQAFDRTPADGAADPFMSPSERAVELRGFIDRMELLAVRLLH